MDDELVSNSSISLDSLEVKYKRKHLKKKISDENVDTILVPLYDKDVLIKVPKRKQKHTEGKKTKSKESPAESRNYLVNKDPKQKKKASYLEMFRKRITPNCSEPQNKKVSNEIRSISPEFGDTERESIGCESYDPADDFYNTESYNEMYYDKILKTELEQYLERSFEELLHFDEDITKCQEDVNCNNLRSVSEVTQPRRRSKQKIVPPIQNVRLGGLGPDMENIKPRLERARSLQRYSEKVRMENRLKIYKKGIENDKMERETSATRRNPIQGQIKEQAGNRKKSSYLINKTEQNQPEHLTSLFKKICPKSKSADIQKFREREKAEKETKNLKHNINQNRNEKKAAENKTTDAPKNAKSARENINTERYGNSCRNKSSKKTREININTKENKNLSPVQISFLVNVGGVRPSSALRTLEEKHKMYQEKVKAYCPEFKNV